MIKNYNRFLGGNMARILCPHCNKKLLIEASKQLSDSVRDIYGTCVNETCLARPVMTISHKSDRTPPLSQIKGQNGLIAKMLEGMSDQERQKILEQFKPLKKTA